MTTVLIVLLVIFILTLVIGGGNKCLPERLRKRHDDWIWIVSWVPRGWTARCGWAWPQPPKLLVGDSGWEMTDHHRFGHHTEEEFKKYRHIMPIPKRDHFMVTVVFFLHFIPLPMMAWTFKNEDYISLGLVRWDNVDKYYDRSRVRAHGTLGRIAMGIFIAGLAVLVYWGLK